MMDLPPISIEPTVPVEPLGAQPQAGTPNSEIAEGGDQEPWMFLIHTILTKSFSFKRAKNLLIQHKIRPEGKCKNKTLAVPLKQCGISGKLAEVHLPHLSRKLESELPCNTAKDIYPKGFVTEKNVPKEGKGLPVSDLKYAPLPHGIFFKAVQQRIIELFKKLESKEKLPSPFAEKMAEKDLVADGRQYADKIDVRERQPADQKEKVTSERTRERDRAKEDRVEETRADKVTLRLQSIQNQAILPIERLSPAFLLSLGPLQAVVQNLMASPEFCSAKGCIIVQGMVEKAFLSHLIRQFGSVHKQLYIWALGTGEPHGLAWRFLKQVGLPYATLFHLDLGRKSGGWDRLKHTLRQLIALNNVDELSDEMVAAMPAWDEHCDGMSDWIQVLASYGVFFASPLDFDYMLLRSYGNAYPVTSNDIGWEKIMNAPPSQVGGYTKDDLLCFGTYYDLFCRSNRLLIHQEAWRLISPLDLIKNMPVPIERLLSYLLTSF